ncbi:sulfite exporter TauE/SafE family protein [Flavobacterium sp. '19STA2R22 D10 B1']|uniref:sulfite exporter TauE/SafE family protein n=1 Tax=Flavobacterium aerium TaxID=3037261 RepID=UPI00278C2ACA|nr:sulfite exporter TauE/SafE family protein [Flavobacterium sp. '19STA2R22 D10 B1']
MLWSAILLGFFSSFHCVGMCGPIAVMLPVDHGKPVKKFFQILFYHTGRFVAYGSIGLLFGSIGKGLYVAGIQQKISIIIGILMIMVVWIPERTFQQYNFSRPIYRVISKVKSALGKQFKKRTFKSLFTIGLLNGFLPCGMIYMALFGAIAMGNPFTGSLYMILFGLGTLPLLTSVIYIGNFLALPVRNKIQRAIPYITVLIGMLFIIRGLGLGIPYVSPSNMNLIVKQNPTCIVP